MIGRLLASYLAAPVLLFLSAPLAAAEPAAPDFNREVRPILSAHCFKCHGPDDKVREAGLRLDRREAATAKLESEATAIVPGKPDKSELVRRIFSTDEGELMPPPAANKPLSAAAERHAAPLDRRRRRVCAALGVRARRSKSPLPTVKQTDWPQNPIDHFMLARLEAAGLAPSPPADKYTLVRRALSRSHRPAADAGGGRCVRRTGSTPTPTSSWSIGCSPRPTTANAGPAAGSIWPATPTPTATRRTASARSGPIATG